jgi:hypothetical protein
MEGCVELKKRIIKYEGEEQQLLQDIVKTKQTLEAIYSNFEYVVDPDLIDSYIYEMNAVQKRYKVLLERAKQIDVLCSYEFHEPVHY